MSITQTVEIPTDHWLTIEVPSEVPAGKAILTFTSTEMGQKKIPIFGCAKGQFHMADDFDAPLEDFRDYM